MVSIILTFTLFVKLPQIIPLRVFTYVYTISNTFAKTFLYQGLEIFTAFFKTNRNSKRIEFKSGINGLFSFSELDGWIPDLFSLVGTSRCGLPVFGLTELLSELGYYREAAVTAFDIFSFLSTAAIMLEVKEGVVCFTHQHFKEISDFTFLGELSLGFSKSFLLFF